MSDSQIGRGGCDEGFRSFHRRGGRRDPALVCRRRSGSYDGGPLASLCYRAALAHDARASATEVCTRAINEESLAAPDRAATFVNRGIVYMSAGHFADADDDFDTALEISAKPARWLAQQGFPAAPRRQRPRCAAVHSEGHRRRCRAPGAGDLSPAAWPMSRWAIIAPLMPTCAARRRLSPAGRCRGSISRPIGWRSADRSTGAEIGVGRQRQHRHRRACPVSDTASRKCPLHGRS